MTYLPPSLVPPSSHPPQFASGRSDHCTATLGMSSPAPRPASHQAPPQLPLLGFPQRPLRLLHRAPQLHTPLQHLHRAPGLLHTLAPASERRRTWGKQPGIRREEGRQLQQRCFCLCFSETHQLGVFVSSYALHHSLAGVNQNHRGHDSCSSGTNRHSLLAATVISWRVTSTCVVASHRSCISIRLCEISNADSVYNNSHIYMGTNNRNERPNQTNF